MRHYQRKPQSTRKSALNTMQDPNFLLDTIVIDAVNRRDYTLLREKFTYHGVKSVLSRHADRITPHLTIR